MSEYNEPQPRQVSPSLFCPLQPPLAPKKLLKDRVGCMKSHSKDW